MECYIHPDQDAVGACVACGNFICDVCRVSMKGKNYCKACVERGEANPPPPPPGDHGSAGRFEQSNLGSLKRSRSDKVIGGVCGGLAKQLEMDVSLVRVLAALGTLFFFTLFGLLMGLITDLTYTLIDPRIDFETREV